MKLYTRVRYREFTDEKCLYKLYENTTVSDFNIVYLMRMFEIILINEGFYITDWTPLYSVIKIRIKLYRFDETFR